MDELVAALARVGATRREVKRWTSTLGTCTALDWGVVLEGVEYLELMSEEYRQDAFKRFGFSPLMRELYSVSGAKGWFDEQKMEKYWYAVRQEFCGWDLGSPFVAMTTLVKTSVRAVDRVWAMTCGLRAGPDCLAQLHLPRLVDVSEVEKENALEELLKEGIRRISVSSPLPVHKRPDEVVVRELVDVVSELPGQLKGSGLEDGLDCDREEEVVEHLASHSQDGRVAKIGNFGYLDGFGPGYKAVAMIALGSRPLLKDFIRVYLTAHVKGFSVGGCRLEIPERGYGWDLYRDGDLFVTSKDDAVGFMTACFEALRAGYHDRQMESSNVAVQQLERTWREEHVDEYDMGSDEGLLAMSVQVASATDRSFGIGGWRGRSRGLASYVPPGKLKPSTRARFDLERWTRDPTFPARFYQGLCGPVGDGPGNVVLQHVRVDDGETYEDIPLGLVFKVDSGTRINQFSRGGTGKQTVAGFMEQCVDRQDDREYVSLVTMDGRDANGVCHASEILFGRMNT